MENTDLPLVSLVIPAYNSRDYIRRAVDSCLAQTYPTCEIVIVDDGSTDGTPDLLRETYAEHIGDRIRIIEQANRGAAGARNTGVREARGEFVQFCDSDDVLLPEKVEKCYAKFVEFPDIVAVNTFATIIDAATGREIPLPDEQLPSGDIYCQLLVGSFGNFVGTSTVMVRRQAVLDVGGFDESLPVAEDWDLWLRLAARWPFAAVNEPLMTYYKRKGSLQSDEIALAKGRLRVIQRARHYPRREECATDAEYDAHEAARYHTLALIYWRYGRDADTRACFRHAIRLDPGHASARRLYVRLSYVFPAWLASRIVRWGTRLKDVIGR
jgi:glycosyltransferase involved in cell wall biosynthesis